MSSFYQGWAEVKLRKVYMKEWLDRRDGKPNFNVQSVSQSYIMYDSTAVCCERVVPTQSLGRLRCVFNILYYYTISSPYLLYTTLLIWWCTARSSVCPLICTTLPCPAGVDEDEIMTRRYERELEAEDEMGRALSVFGIIKMFETRIQKNKKS